MAKAKKETTEESNVLTPQDIMAAQLNAKENKLLHLHDVEEIYYKVSTGSLLWDIEIGGGLAPGVQRFIGPPESGKSSAALEVCRNFLEYHKQQKQSAKGLYVKSEGRLPREMMERSGLKFVSKPEEWVDGTIFVFETKIYEFVINTLRKLVKNPENKTLFCFIIDSTDGLMLKSDFEKEVEEDAKVAGTPKLTKRFLQTMSDEMSKRGHLCLMTSQYSTNIQLDKYASAENKRPKQGQGGWGLAHYANFAFEFLDPTSDDLIRPNMDKPPGIDNQLSGKRVRIRFKKTLNEKTGTQISYPIKYKVKGKSSVWNTVEVLDIMKAYSMIKIATWINFPVTLGKEVEDATGTIVPDKFNGEKKLTNWLDGMPEVVNYLFNKFKDNLVKLGQASENTEEIIKDETQTSEF